MPDPEVAFGTLSVAPVDTVGIAIVIAGGDPTEALALADNEGEYNVDVVPVVSDWFACGGEGGINADGGCRTLDLGDAEGDMFGGLEDMITGLRALEDAEPVVAKN